MKNRLTLKTTRLCGDVGDRAPLHEPGAEFRYSNYGMLLLGAIIERVSGMCILTTCERRCTSRPE